MAYKWRNERERLGFAEYVSSNEGIYTYAEVGEVWASFNNLEDAPNRNQAAAAKRDLSDMRKRINGSAPANTREGDDRRTKKLDKLSHKSEVQTSQDSVQDALSNLPGDITFDDLVDIADTLKGAIDDDDNVLTHAEFTLGDGGPVGIVFSSCAHMGGRYTDHKAIREFIDRALDISNLYWAPLGDDIEGYLSGFPDKASVHEQPMNIGIQLIMLRAMLNKLNSKNRLLLGTASQHGGKWFEARSGYNPVKDAYRSAGVPWFDGRAYIKLNVGSQVYRLAVAHEFPGHSMYNQLHPHIRALRWNYPSADVVVQGDKHTYAVSEITAYTEEFDTGERASPFVWFVQTGTAKTGLDKYTIKRWPHGIMEWPVLIFESETHNIECTRNWKTVQAWLAPMARGG